MAGALGGFAILGPDSSCARPEEGVATARSQAHHLFVLKTRGMPDEDDLRPPPQAVAWNDHNVYVIGAGFSKDAGIPVVDEFFNRTRDSVHWLKDNHYMREAEAVQRVLHFRLRAAAAAPNCSRATGDISRRVFPALKLAYASPFCIVVIDASWAR